MESNSLLQMLDPVIHVNVFSFFFYRHHEAKHKYSVAMLQRLKGLKLLPLVTAVVENNVILVAKSITYMLSVHTRVIYVIIKDS